MYTKGEWIVTQHSPLSNWVVDVKGDDLIHRVTICQCYDNKDNANLIASTPKLLKACEILANCGVVEDGRVVERIMPSSSDILFAYEILAKAKG